MKQESKETGVILEEKFRAENNKSLITDEVLEELPVQDENNLIIDEAIKEEETISPVIQPKTVMEVNEELIQNVDIKKLKDDPADVKRRRSLRNETAATIKKKPPKYEEIFNCYKRKEYKECIIYIDLVAETAKDWIEYQILKAACLVHLGIKLTEAHKILDEILKINNTNPFSFYAKGLAYYQEEKWQDSIEYFEKSISLDKCGAMQRAELMLKIAKEELEKDVKIIKKEKLDDGDLMDVDESNSNDSSSTKQSSSNKNKDRFMCEICEKPFCKKFNLDRHNKVVHNRETPYIPPLQRIYGRKSEPVVIKKEEEEEEEIVEKEASKSPEVIQKASKRFKIRLGKKIKKAQLTSLTLSSDMARCTYCKKVYRKGSLARHEVIHSGNKQFKCEQCPKAFYQKSDLQRHITTHSDVFDYECQKCDKKFRIKKNLQVHNKRHHSN